MRSGTPLGVIKPHGWIAGVRAGWPERPAFPSAATEIFLMPRINPRTSPGEVRAQFAEFMADLKRRHPDIDLDWQMYGSTPGGTTDPQNWIIQSARRGWETIEGRAYPDPDYLAGQTDGAALRRLGVPTARVGWPWPAERHRRKSPKGWKARVRPISLYPIPVLGDYVCCDRHTNACRAKRWVYRS